MVWFFVECGNMFGGACANRGVTCTDFWCLEHLASCIYPKLFFPPWMGGNVYYLKAYQRERHSNLIFFRNFRSECSQHTSQNHSLLATVTMAPPGRHRGACS